MGKKQKKGEAGAAANYVTRTQALKKLQVPLREFRRLCILKGVFPRSPHKRLRGRDKTYYLLKDIKFLSHEPLLNHIREFRSWKRRLASAHGRQEEHIASKIASQKPQFRLDSILRERYPAFEDALRDIDDALATIHLFATLPAQRTVPAHMIATSARIVAEWQAYITESRSLRKVFLSIKGVYYQARIRGVNITWVVPWKFQTTVPKEVDITVMMTFWDMHSALLRFVMYRLCNDSGLSYPPSTVTRDDAVPPYASVSYSRMSDDSANQAVSTDPQASLFAKSVVFLARETPIDLIAFMVTSCGGLVGWEGPGSPFDVNDTRITHHVVDRPVKHRFLSREYVQPQWVADSINAGILLPVSEYAPDHQLPAHLSPFVDDKAEGYVPARAVAIQEMQAALAAPSTSGDEETSAADEGTASGEESDVAESEQAVPKSQMTSAERERAKLVMSKKSKKLYEKMQHGLKAKQSAIRKLESRRKN